MQELNPKDQQLADLMAEFKTLPIYDATKKAWEHLENLGWTAKEFSSALRVYFVRQGK